MGDTYGFSKVRRKEFLSGKSRFIMDECGCVDDYSPGYINIVGDLDREDFLYRLVKPDPSYLDGLDTELANFIKNVYKSEDEQAIVVTKESVQHAIDVLTELDKKVASMPHKKGEATEIYKRFLENGKWGYVEDKPRDPNDPHEPEKVYVGSCKENVDIYKEVEKVYRHRAYHYGFPWEDGWRQGATYIIECLTSVLDEMTAPDANEYVFLFDWI